jgi:hypothetical protein
VTVAYAVSPRSLSKTSTALSAGFAVWVVVHVLTKPDVATAVVSTDTVSALAFHVNWLRSQFRPWRIEPAI